MKAIQISEFGGPRVLQETDVPEPSPGPGEITIRVRAAGVNYADVMQRAGHYAAPAGGAPFVPGLEVAGTIARRGEGVEGFGDSEKIAAILLSGGYAEYATAPVSRVFRVPDDFTWEEAAAWPVNFLTAWLALNAHTRLQPGQAVLVHAAAGGVGSAAVQIASRLGARVIATAGEPSKLDVARRLGAHVAVDYRSEDFRDAVRSETGGRGVDVALESVGGQTFTRSLDALAPFGKLVKFGSASGAANNLDPVVLMTGNRSVIGFSLPGYYDVPGALQGALDELAELHRASRLAPVVGRSFPLGEAAAAHELLESRKSVGKLVLIPAAP
ncbi:MAG TPA: zinc-binding dehydrogenase [Armatimonadota bacterium]